MEKEIIKGNKLIAEFMGFKIYPKNHYHCYPNLTKITSLVPPQHMRFHDSWDWLMPVVMYIESIGFDVNIKGISCSVSPLLEKETVVQYVLGEKSMKIILVWSTVCKFIEWHNENK